MSKALITEDYLYDIADAIREKKGVTTRFIPAEMKPAILSIPTGSDVDVEPLNVTQNGTYTAPSGKAYSPVTVNVSGGGGGSGKEVATFYGWSFGGGYSSFGTLVKRNGTIYGRVVNDNKTATFVGDLFTLQCKSNGTTALVLTALTAISVTIYTASTSSSEITPMTGDSYQLSADETKSIPNPNYPGGLIITAEAI